MEVEVASRHLLSLNVSLVSFAKDVRCFFINKAFIDDKAHMPRDGTEMGEVHHSSPSLPRCDNRWSGHRSCCVSRPKQIYGPLLASSCGVSIFFLRDDLLLS